MPAQASERRHQEALQQERGHHQQQLAKARAAQVPAIAVLRPSWPPTTTTLSQRLISGDPAKAQSAALATSWFLAGVLRRASAPQVTRCFQQASRRTVLHV